ncbi:hypothetical protein F1559_004087 [Cyanidiococcus yangmingshanensis]|uniref:U3 small nucleolar RNA-associated protein 20 domain-containing protein n=1 Tax=Cyanidiococcus yangmingshanensis TaxID=2690220 RepID=A0A7J7IIA2_9RHOD|nr:hypothetical protein F1559_004087 [Cyanidiococcus yangmingshanensis]
MMQNDWWHALGRLSQGSSATPASTWSRDDCLSTTAGIFTESSVEDSDALLSPDEWLKRLLPLIDGALACLSFGETSSSAPSLFYPLQVLIQTDFYLDALLERHVEEAALLWRRLADCLTRTSHPNLQWFLLSLIERFAGHANRCSWPSSLVQGLVRCLGDSSMHGKHRKGQISLVPKTPEQQVQSLALRLLLQVAASLSTATIPDPVLDSTETLSVTETAFGQTSGDELVPNANELRCTRNRRLMETNPAPASNEPEREAALAQVTSCAPLLGSLPLLLDTLVMLIARKSMEESLRLEVMEAFTSVAGRTAARLPASKGTDLLERLAQLMERVDCFPVASRLRWELARSIQQLADCMPKSSRVRLAAALLERMNRFSSTSIGQIDWDTVLAAYAYRFTDEPATNWSILVPHLSAALQHRDGAIRSAAGDALVRLVLASLPAEHPNSNNVSSGTLSTQVEGHREPRPRSAEEATITIALSGTDSSFLALLHRVIMLLRKKAILASSLTLLRTAMSVLGRLVRALPQGLDPSWVDAIAPLTNSDETQDVFETIAHVQLALRIRALERLEEAPVSLTVQRGLLLPLAERVLQLASGSRTSQRQVDERGRQRAIWLASARRLVTRLAARFAPADVWKRLAWLVRRYDRQVRTHRVVERDEIPSQQPHDETLVIRKQVDPHLLLAYVNALSPGRRQQHDAQETANTDHEQVPKDDQEYGLVLEILERLESHLYSPQTAATSGQVPGTPAWLNRPLFETLVLALARQPMSVMAARVPRLVTRLLRDVGLRADQRRRDDAREALQTLVRELGPSWLSVVFQQLADSSNLPAATGAGKHTDGSFRAHVWPYTVQVLLQTVASMDTNGTPLLGTPTLESALWIALTEFRDPQIEAEKKVTKLYADVREAHVSSLWASVSLLGQLWPRQVADLGSAFVLLVRALRHRLRSDTKQAHRTESESGEYRAASLPELEQWRRLLHHFVLGITRQALEPDQEAEIQAITVCIRYLLEKPSVGCAAPTRSVSTRLGRVQAATSVPKERTRLSTDELNRRSSMDSARLSMSGGIVGHHCYLLR